MKRIAAIIQGRMSSSRLPGKILADIAGQPMLQRVPGGPFLPRGRTRTRGLLRIQPIGLDLCNGRHDDPSDLMIRRPNRAVRVYIVQYRVVYFNNNITNT